MLRSVFFLLFCIFVATAHAEAPSRATLLIASCAACHSPDIAANSVIPTIYGKDPSYIKTSMLAFKNGTRPATLMNRLAKGYSDEEIDLMANYLAKYKK